MSFWNTAAVEKIKACLPFRARTIEIALRRVLPPSLVHRIKSDIPASDLIEHISKDYQLNRDKLLGMVAEELQISPALRLEPIDDSLLEIVSFTPDELMEMSAVPQKWKDSKNHFALAIADPRLVNSKRLKKIGVVLLLSTGSAISEIWANHKRKVRVQSEHIVYSKHIELVLQKLADDAFELGAQEVFVGHPEPDHYEFSASGDVYSGTVHSSVYPELCQILVNSNSFDVKGSNPKIRKITAAMTKSFERPVVCITWDSVAERKTKPVVDNKIITNVEKIESVPTVSKPLLMLVDDDSRFSFILEKILEEKKFEVRRFSGAEKALQALEDGLISPNLILCDVHMPKMDGISLVRRLRTTSYSLPILMLTSEDDPAIEAELALLGINAYVKKREDPRVLMAWINNLVGRKSEMELRCS